MDATLHALGRILLDAVPTFLIVLILIIYLRRMFFRPIARILDQRYEATVGAERAAEESMRQAEQRVAEYEDKLRAARQEIYAEQAKILKQMESEHAARLEEARREAERRVLQAAAELKAEADQAGRDLEARSGEIADQIANRILEGRAA
jgi:F-type H+-transporting ATPase subunit b